MGKRSNKPRYRVKDGKPIASIDGMTFVGDGLMNVMQGLNTASDSRSYDRFTFGDEFGGMWDDPHQLYAAVRSSWLARAIIDMPAEDGLREWRKFTCEQAEEIQKEEKRVRLSSRFRSLSVADRMTGGAVMVMLIEGQDLSEPLDLNRVGKGSLKGLRVFDRYEVACSEANITDPLSENFLMPGYYTIAGGHTVIHHSNCVVMTGVNTSNYLRRMEQGWGDSVLRQCMSDIKDIVASKEGLAALLRKASVDIFKTPAVNYAANDEAEQLAIKRITSFKMGLSNHNLGVINEAEELLRLGAQFGGTSEALNKLMIYLSGALKIPMTKLFGVQSKGMGDSGEGDQKNYNTTLKSAQEVKYRPALEVVDEVLVRSALGYFPDDCEFEWNPLYQESGAEKAQGRLANVQADQIDLDMGVVTVSQLQRKRQAEDEYFYDEADIEKLAMYEKEQLEVMTSGDPDFGIGGDELMEGEGVLDPSKSLNGAQVSALLDVIEKIETGGMSKETGEKVLYASFPLSEQEAKSLLSGVEYGKRKASVSEKNESGSGQESEKENTETDKSIK